MVFPKNDKFEKKIAMNFPSELKYTKDHEWVRMDGEFAIVGITEFAQQELGDIVFVDITTIDEAVAENEIFGTIEAVKTVSDLFMPMQGTVMAVNEKLDASPELVNQDPYGEGWMVKVKVDNAADFDSLLTAEQYKETIGV